MADRPMIFSAPMVRALLNGTKSMTRRVLKPQPFPVGGPFYRPFEKTDPCLWYSVSAAGTVANIQKVPYAPGDRLWVKESVAWVSAWGWRYRADNDDLDEKRESGEVGRWCSPIHMQKNASRLTLTVTEVRVQRLNELTEEDAVAEGCGVKLGGWFIAPGLNEYERTARIAFGGLWNSLHGPGAWDENPWVAAISFRCHLGNIDQMGSGDG